MVSKFELNDRDVYIVVTQARTWRLQQHLHDENILRLKSLQNQGILLLEIKLFDLMSLY